MIAAKQGGMTLLELLVALTVFSIAAIAILDTVATTSREVQYLESRTIAHWVASNEIDKQRLELQTSSISPFPKVGIRRDEVEMSNRQWYITTKVEATARKDMRKMTVQVRAEQDGQVLGMREWFFSA